MEHGNLIKCEEGWEKPCQSGSMQNALLVRCFETFIHVTLSHDTCTFLIMFWRNVWFKTAIPNSKYMCAITPQHCINMLGSIHASLKFRSNGPEPAQTALVEAGSEALDLPKYGNYSYASLTVDCADLFHIELLPFSKIKTVVNPI